MGETLRILTKDAWTQADLDRLDDCWRTASRSDLFADEFEAERHRIQHSAEAAAKQLDREPAEEPGFRQPTLW